MSQVYFPPGVECFHPNGFGAYNATAFKEGDCEVTDDMVQFLNLTSSISNYIAAYCLNPARDDNCPFGFCPNPDITGMCDPCTPLSSRRNESLTVVKF